MPGKPIGLGHYEFIVALLPEAPQDYSKRLVVLFSSKTANKLPFLGKSSDGRLAKFCAAVSKPLWDPKGRQTPLLPANHRRRSVFFEVPQALLAGESGFRPWLPQERTRGASARARSQQGLQSGHQQRPYWLGDAELICSSLAEAASLVVASSEPTGNVIPMTAFLVGTAFSARRSNFFSLRTENGSAKNNSRK